MLKCLSEWPSVITVHSQLLKMSPLRHHPGCSTSCRRSLRLFVGFEENLQASQTGAEKIREFSAVSCEQN